MLNPADVLIFVEDPGAANFVASLPAELQRRGRRVLVLTQGLASSYLQERGLKVATIPGGETAATILATVRPAVLVAGTSENPDSMGLQLIAQARPAGVASVGVVDAYANAAYRFRGRTEHPLAFAPDWLLTPDAPTSGAFVSLGYPADRVVTVGHPHYDLVRWTRERRSHESITSKRARHFPAVPEGRQIVLFAAEISSGCQPRLYQKSKDYTLTGRGQNQGRTFIVLEEFILAISQVNQRPYLVLRLHPKNTREEFAAYLGEFDEVSQGGSALEILAAVDLVVGMTSMLLMEAALLGRPTLSIVPRPEEKAWLPGIAAGLIQCTTTRQELCELLPVLLAGQAQPAAPQPAAPGLLAGALARMADFIQQLLKVEPAPSPAPQT
jgi:hypothetical protein